jgi:rod shape-determining protein MreC
MPWIKIECNEIRIDLPVKKRAAGSVVHLTQPLRALTQRFSFLLLVVAAAVLMLLGKVDTMLVEQVCARVIDAVVPILDAMSRPAATAARAVEAARRMVEVDEENEHLREANQQLLQWQQVALRLEAENASLRNLLHFKADPGVTGVTGRVVADPGGPLCGPCWSTSVAETVCARARRRWPGRA